MNMQYIHIQCALLTFYMYCMYNVYAVLCTVYTVLFTMCPGNVYMVHVKRAPIA